MKYDITCYDNNNKAVPWDSITEYISEYGMMCVWGGGGG